MTAIRKNRTRAALGATAVAAAMVVATPLAAHAITITTEYDVVGTSTIASTGSTVDLGPATLRIAAEAASGQLSGTLPLPPTRSSFKAAGFLPTEATITFEEAAPLTGTLGRSPERRPVVDTVATYTLRLSDVKIGGLPALVGPRCRTAEPVSIPAGTPPGESFNLNTGGRLTGTYTIGDFTGCRLATPLINALVPGEGNTVELVASNGRRVLN